MSRKIFVSLRWFLELESTPPCCIELQLGIWVHAYPCLTNSCLANIYIEQTTMLLEIVRSFPRLLILWKSPFISLFCMIVVSHVRLEYVFTFRSSTPANQQTSRLVSISDLLVCQKSKDRITLHMMECFLETNCRDLQGSPMFLLNLSDGLARSPFYNHNLISD